MLQDMKTQGEKDASLEGSSRSTVQECRVGCTDAVVLRTSRTRKFNMQHTSTLAESLSSLSCLDLFIHCAQ